MTKELVSPTVVPKHCTTFSLSQTFDVHYDNELAHEYYGDGERLAKRYEN
jgi:hypothetical protein